MKYYDNLIDFHFNITSFKKYSYVVICYFSSNYCYDKKSIRNTLGKTKWLFISLSRKRPKCARKYGKYSVSRAKTWRKEKQLTKSFAYITNAYLSSIGYLMNFFFLDFMALAHEMKIIWTDNILKIVNSIFQFIYDLNSIFCSAIYCCLTYINFLLLQILAPLGLWFFLEL